MLTVNIDVWDRLVNGQLGTVMHISKNRIEAATRGVL